MSGWLWLAGYVGCGLVAGTIAAAVLQEDKSWKDDDAMQMTAGVAMFWPLAAGMVALFGILWGLGKGCTAAGRLATRALAARRAGDQPAKGADAGIPEAKVVKR